MGKFFGKVFDEFFEKSSNELEANPKYNIEKLAFDTYMLTLAVPGYNKDNLSITFNKGVLTIKGRTDSKTERNSKDFLYHGFTTSSFENNFSLSEKLKIVEANLSHGVLHIILKDQTSQKDMIAPITRNNNRY